MNGKLNTGDRGNGTAQEWLAGLMLRRDSKLLSRFVFYFREMQQRPRYWRRLLRRKLAVTVTGAALLLALAGGPIGSSVLAEPAAPSATINVVDGEVAINDNDKCSLIEAIINARAIRVGQLHDDCIAGNLTGPDTVSLPANGLFVLTEPHNSQFGPTGLPVITTAVTIEGNGATIQRSSVSGTPDFRVLAVDTTGNLTLRNVTISNGFATEHYDAYDGGAILNKNVLTIENGTFRHNTNDGGSGGAIFSEAGTTTTITGSLFDGNRVWYEYESGGALAIAGEATISHTTVTGNTAQIGGGISVEKEGEVLIAECLIDRNGATSDYGSAGGGIASLGIVTILNTTISNNSAFGGIDYGGSGGGVSVGGTATIVGTSIVNNRATTGSEYGTSELFEYPGLGGGVSITGSAQMSNSTVSGNQANRGGGILNDGHLTLVHSTVTGNLGWRDVDEYTGDQPGRGGGLYSAYYNCYFEGDTVVTILKGSVVSGNDAPDGGPEMLIRQGTNCNPIVTGDAFNIFGHSDNSGTVGFAPGPSDIIPTVGLSAILSPLADNGGPTQTHALPPGSPALDLAPSASCLAAPVNGVDQRGELRNQNGAGAVTANECDAGSFELAMPPAFLPFLVSPVASGKVGGVAFTPADILKYDPATGWSMFFDGSDVGVTRNLVAFEVLNNGRILMSFVANQPTPAGTFTPQDIARFVPTTTGPNTAGSFQWAFDGSANFLTTTSEKVDALGDVGDGRLALSTNGTAAVKRPDGTVLKAQDEDALGLVPATGEWSAYFNGTPIPGLKGEDVNALWVDPETNDLYVSIVGAFNLGGVRGNGKDIVKLTKTPGAPGGYVPSLWWDGSAEGFPLAIDGLEIVP